MNIDFLQLFVCEQNDTRMHQGFNPYPFLAFPLAIKDWGQDCASDMDFVLLFAADPVDPSPDAFKELWKTTEEQLAGWDMDPGVPVTLSRGRFGLVASLSEDLQIEVSCGETALGSFWWSFLFHMSLSTGWCFQMPTDFMCILCSYVLACLRVHHPTYISQNITSPCLRWTWSQPFQIPKVAIGSWIRCLERLSTTIPKPWLSSWIGNLEKGHGGVFWV